MTRNKWAEFSEESFQKNFKNALKLFSCSQAGGRGGGRLDLFVQKVGRSVWRQNLSESRHILDKGQTWKARHSNEWRRPLIITRTNEILFTGRYGY